jgi:hypothetical protein
MAVAERGLVFSHSVAPWTHMPFAAVGRCPGDSPPWGMVRGCASIRAEGHSYSAGVAIFAAVSHTAGERLRDLPEWQQICTSKDRVELTPRGST